MTEDQQARIAAIRERLTNNPGWYHDEDGEPIADLTFLLDALASAQAAAPSRWRDIATAPKDGRSILLWEEGRGVVEGFWHRGDSCSVPHWSPVSYLFSPTYWMPRPDPPVFPEAPHV